MPRSRELLLVAMLGSIALPAAAAQTADSTQVTITVSDSTGARIADATLVLSRATEQRTFTTGGDGTLTMRGLATGAWTLSVSREGFETRQRPVVVQRTPVAVSVTLDVAGPRQDVLVEAVRPEDALQLDTAASGGTRLDIPVRELPASISIITQELMQERGISSATDATELAPGVTTFVDSGSIPGINSRGFSSTNGSVSVTRDGIRQNTVPQAGRPLDTFLLERVEILKGPASLMAGEGAVGASINYVTKEPRRTLEVDTLAAVGSWDKYRAGLGISVPFARTLAARIDYSHADGGGYVERTGDKLQSAAASILWTPRPAVNLKASAVYTHDSIRSYYGTPIIDGAIDPRTRFLNYNMRDNLNKATNNYGRFDADFVLPRGWTLHNGFFAATQDVHWRNFESTQFNPTTRLVSVGSYFLAQRDDLLLGNQVDVRKSFTVLGRSVSVVGGYLVQDNDQMRWTGGTIPNQTRTVDPYNPAPIFDPGFPFVFDRHVQVGTHTLFGESQVALHDQFKIVAGLRWERFQVDRNQVTTGRAIQAYYPTTGRIGAVYLLNPVVTFYGSLTHAVEPVTPLVSITATNMGFSLQPSRQWETGTKATVLGGRLDATAAYFAINKKNILTSNVVDNVRLTQQIGEQMSQGVEVSASARPIAGLVLVTDVTFLNAEFVEFNENLGTGIVSRAGNDVAHMPAVVWNFTPMQRIGPVTLSATVRRVGERWRNTANTIRLQPYTTLSASVSTRFLSGTRLTVTGRNLTDELYIPRSNSDVTGRLGAPRSFEIQIARVFGPAARP